VTYDELDESIEQVYDAITGHVTLEADGPPIGVTLDRYEIVQDQHIVELSFSYRFAHDVDRVTVTSTLDAITRPDHRHLVAARVGGALSEAILDSSQRQVVIDQTAPARRSVVARFIVLGIEHIVTGYDHLAFLVCLLLGTTTRRAVVFVVTSFTVAHSITLGLAVFDAVVLPSRLVESLIAVTIGYVAVENLLSVQTFARYRVTFVFGLIHGFGFSNVLRDMQLPKADLVWSLFSFNAGVELGQLAFVLLLYPVLVYARSRATWPRVRAVLSGSVAVLALYWFIERAFGI
jgi:hypothetical protein